MLSCNTLCVCNIACVPPSLRQADYNIVTTIETARRLVQKGLGQINQQHSCDLAVAGHVCCNDSFIHFRNRAAGMLSLQMRQDASIVTLNQLLRVIMGQA